MVANLKAHAPNAHGTDMLPTSPREAVCRPGQSRHRCQYLDEVLGVGSVRPGYGYGRGAILI
jgi:hypothetical protein